MKNLIKIMPLSLMTLMMSQSFAGVIATESNVENQSTESVEQLKSERTNKFKPVVLPFYDPSIEAGIMALPVYAFYPDDNDLVSDASSIALPLIYTSNESFIGKVVGDVILNEDNFRIQFETGYTGVNTDILGIATKKEEIDFDVDFMFKTFDDVYVGFGGIYKQSKYNADNASEQMFLNGMGFTEDYESDAGYRFSMQWDTREHFYYPHSGFSWEFNYENHAEWLGNDEDKTYSSLFTDFRHFYSINENPNNIIATKLVGRYLIDAENAPSSAYTTYGRQGKEIQRGYAVGDYIASNMANLEVEYRHKFSDTGNKHLDNTVVVLIGGAGKSFGYQVSSTEKENFSDADWLGVAGVGLRYTVLPYERMNIKMDLTQNTDGETIVYFGFGESI